MLQIWNMPHVSIEMYGVRCEVWVEPAAATSSNFYFKSNNGLLSIKSIFVMFCWEQNFMSHVNRSNASKNSFVFRLAWEADRKGADLLFVRQARGFGCFRLVIVTAQYSTELSQKSQFVNFTIYSSRKVARKYPFTSTSELQMWNFSLVGKIEEENAKRKSVERVLVRETRTNDDQLIANLLHNRYILNRKCDGLRMLRETFVYW